MAASILNSKRNFSLRLVLSIFIVGSAVRLFWLAVQNSNIGGEGAVYARFAENFLKGNGYVGISLGSTDLVFPPLYPILIAFASLATGDFELAGRVVSLIIGACLVIPVFFITLEMYGKRVAYIAAGLTALHPLLIQLSGSVYSEATYITFLMAGIYWALKTSHIGSVGASVLVGTFFGLAYLTRPEGIIYSFLSAAVILILGPACKRTLKQSVMCSLGILGAFTVIASPYVGFLSLTTGQLRFEGKSAINYLIGQRMLAGMEYNEAAYGITKDLIEEGPFLQDRIAPIEKTSLGDISRYVLMAARTNVSEIYQTIFFSSAFGSPVLIVLVILGIFRTPWSSRRIIDEGVLLIFVTTIVLTLLSIQHLWDRYSFQLLPFLLLWAAKGICELADWAEATAVSLMGTIRGRSDAVRVSSQWALSLIFLLYVSTSYAHEFKKTHSQKDPIKEAGFWLGKHAGGPKKIMDGNAVIAYYANGTWIPLPYAESSVALEYLNHKSPDFVVLTRGGSGIRPYLDDWIQKGIPNSNANLVYSRGNALEEKIMIYRWNSSPMKGFAKR